MAAPPVVGGGALLVLTTYCLLHVTYPADHADHVPQLTYVKPVHPRIYDYRRGPQRLEDGGENRQKDPALLQGGGPPSARGRSRRDIRQLTEDEKQLIVDMHNRIRSEVGASNMQQLTWSSDLEASSVGSIKLCEFPSKLSSQDTSCATENHSMTKDTKASALDIINEWQTQGSFYDYSSNECVNGAECKNYKQLVRADVARLGCATTVCPLLAVDGPSSEGELVFACHYSPSTPQKEGGLSYPEGSGLYMEGPPCAACPPHLTACRRGLCAEPAVLDELNAFRRQLGAASMPRLSWNNSLAELAADEAGACPPPGARPVEGVLTGRLVVGRGVQEEGQVRGVHLRDALRAATTPLHDYDYLSNTCTTPSCHHALHIVQDVVTSVGCHHSVCHDGSGQSTEGTLVLVCFFYPRMADVTSQRPYIKGPVCSMCPSDAPHCEDGLCVRHPACHHNSPPARSLANDPQSSQDMLMTEEGDPVNETSTERPEDVSVNQTEITTSDDDGSMETLNLVTTADGLDGSTNDTTDESAMNLETTTTVLSGTITDTDIVLVISFDGGNTKRRKRETADTETQVLDALRGDLAISVNEWCAARPTDCCMSTSITSSGSAARPPLLDASRILVVGGMRFDENTTRVYHAAARPRPDNPLCAPSDVRRTDDESLSPGVFVAAVRARQEALSSSLTACCQARLHSVYRRHVIVTSQMTSDPGLLYGLTLWAWIIVVVTVIMTLLFVLTGLILRYKKNTLLSDTSSLRRFVDSPELHRRRYRRRASRHHQYRPPQEDVNFRLPPRAAPLAVNPYLFRAARRPAPAGPLPHYIGAGVRTDYEEIRSRWVAPPAARTDWRAGPEGARRSGGYGAPSDSTLTPNPGLWPPQGIPVPPPRGQYENHPRQALGRPHVHALYQNGPSRLYGNTLGAAPPSNTSSNTIEHFFFERNSQS